jgi:hypothetical protein
MMLVLSRFQDDYEYSRRRARTIKFIKAALVQTSTAALTQDLLDRTQLAEDARKKRKSVPRRVLRGGGAIHVFEARREIRTQTALSSVADHKALQEDDGSVP